MKNMLKIIVIGIIMVMCVMVILLLVNHLFQKGNERNERVMEYTISLVDFDADDSEIITFAKSILYAISNKDFSSIADVAHPDYGVVFSPYATVDLSTDCCFTALQIENFGSDSKKYIWGIYDGSAEPIEMTPIEFFNEFIFDADFTRCENFGVDTILRAGNSLENISEVFDTCRFVDCYMPGSDEENWQSLRLVFEEYEGKLMLSAIVHSENTI